MRIRALLPLSFALLLHWNPSLRSQDWHEAWADYYFGGKHTCIVENTEGQVFAAGVNALADNTLFVRRIDPRTGAALWTKKFGSFQGSDGGSLAGIRRMVLDKEGNPIVVGWTRTQHGDKDLILARLSKTNGAYLGAWPVGYDGTGTNQYDDYGNDIAVDSDNNIYVAGVSGRAGKESQFWVLKFAPSGGVALANRQIPGFGGPNGAVRIAIDAEGSIIAGGYAARQNKSGLDLFVAKLSGDLDTTVWRARESSSETVHFLLIEGNSRVVAVGDKAIYKFSKHSSDGVRPSLIWSSNIAIYGGSALILGNSDIIVGAVGGGQRVRCYNGNNGTLKWNHSLGGQVQDLGLMPDGRLLVFSYPPTSSHCQLTTLRTTDGHADSVRTLGHGVEYQTFHHAGQDLDFATGPATAISSSGSIYSLFHDGLAKLVPGSHGPSATLAAPEALSAATARIRGTLSAGSNPATAWFEYGSVGGPRTATPAQSFSASTSQQTISSVLSNLAPGQLIDCSLVVQTAHERITEKLHSPYQHRISIPPTVRTTGISGIGPKAATVSCEVVSDGGSPLVERGVVYATFADPDITTGSRNINTFAENGVGAFDIPLGSWALSEGTTYFVRAFAINGQGTAYGEVRVFTTDTVLATSSGSASAARTILPGDRHVFHFEIAGASRQVSLSSGGGVPLTARLFDDGGRLVAESTTAGDFQFHESLDTGSYSLVIERSAGSLDAPNFYRLEIDSHAVAAETRPDVAVGTSTGDLKGTDVYASRQQVNLASRKARTVRGFATVANRGKTADQIAVAATRGSRFFKTAYHDASGSLTASLTSGSYRTAAMDETDAPVQIRATITPDRRKLTKRRGSRKSILRKTSTLLVRARSTLDPSIGDAGSIHVRTQ